jgi:polysaccharide pyruvyl transferase WcaK-like protein/MoaA/NifB/PqqE/SkfB family radical SAM enzyme
MISNFMRYLKEILYLVKSRPYRLEKPIVLQFPVIDICNSKCQMCHIWKNKKNYSISLSDLRKGIKNPLFSDVVSVGINGGEPTLRGDLSQIVELLFEEVPNLRSISLITNALNANDVVFKIKEIGSLVQKYNGTLDVMISLDGYGDLHDLIRGRVGSFVNAQKVIEFAQDSSLVSSFQVGCTIIKDNVYGLSDLLEYCRSKNIYIKYRLGIPHKRLYTENLKEPYALSFEEKYHVIEFLEGLISHYEVKFGQKFFYRSLISQIRDGAPRQAGCDWQHRGATISSSGELLYCAVQSNNLGKVYKIDSKKVYFANEDHVKDIIRTKCARCYHDYVGLPPKSQQIKHLAIRVCNLLRLSSIIRRLYKFSHLNYLRNRRRFALRLSFMKTLATQHESVNLPRNAKRVLICGWYGTETLGDKGILGGVVHALQQTFGSPEFTLVSLHPYVSEMTRLQMNELDGCQIITPQDGVRFAPAMDLVVFGGGPLMALDELADMEVIFAAARMNNVPTMLAGCGVGPIGDPWHNASLRRILSLSSLRVYRDARSKVLAADLGVESPSDEVAEDPAFTWLFNQRARLKCSPSKVHKILTLGLRDFPHDAYARHLSDGECRAAKHRYESAVIKGLECLIVQHDDLTIRPMPMCTNHFGSDDRLFYRDLFRNNDKLLNKLDTSFLNREFSPLDCCEAFSSSHVVLGMRFHSLVFSIGLNIPVVAIDYTLGKGKVHALVERFSIPYKSLVELDVDFVVDEVNRMLNEPVDQAQDFSPKFTDVVKRRVPGLMKKNMFSAQ